MSNTTSTMFMIFILLQFHTAMSGPLKIDDIKKIPSTTELQSMKQKDLDQSLPFPKSVTRSSRMLGNVMPNSNIPIDALNNNQVIFGNVLPNGNPSVTTGESGSSQMSQKQQVTKENPLSSMQPMTGNVLPNSNPTVTAANGNQIIFGNFLPNGNPMVTTSNAGPLSSLASMNPSHGISTHDNPVVNSSEAAIDNSMIGTSSAILLGTRPALLIPMSSVPSIIIINPGSFNADEQSPAEQKCLTTTA